MKAPAMRMPRRPPHAITPRMIIHRIATIAIITTTMMATITTTSIATTTIITAIPMLMSTNKAPVEGLGGISEREAAALYRLMTWLSPSFPVGGFSYSSGIEWAVEAGDISDAASLKGWLASMLADGAGFCDGVFLAHAHRAAASRDEAALRLMAKGVREGFAAVRALGHAVTPFALRVLFTWLPPAFAVRYWRGFFASDMADYVFGRHARAAANEMREVANDCRAMLITTGVQALALHRLYAAIDAYVDNRRPAERP